VKPRFWLKIDIISIENWNTFSVENAKKRAVPLKLNEVILIRNYLQQRKKHQAS
jgi:hypothetical protein